MSGNRYTSSLRGVPVGRTTGKGKTAETMDHPVAKPSNGTANRRKLFNVHRPERIEIGLLETGVEGVGGENRTAHFKVVLPSIPRLADE
ncbi:hypothetical protein HK104_000040 [Borealophlyctis nickersoniae]|nr:hypothetical protein HK104_000040 [Borealophlyctis nickersoniae]